ncbi:hypothetical protein FB45DRAFT_1110080 [Roridomyces roridus]|uniref:Uncharacterized protein n=1 Tax=Roridomyces roridus TaxID=1738132 RepID=A0AAD7FER1_9AGAR|nr:hypothetical protein FB45DRAFT_1110080 [Roridomyces roridus]
MESNSRTSSKSRGTCFCSHMATARQLPPKCHLGTRKKVPRLMPPVICKTKKLKIHGRISLFETERRVPNGVLFAVEGVKILLAGHKGSQTLDVYPFAKPEMFGVHVCGYTLFDRPSPPEDSTNTHRRIVYKLHTANTRHLGMTATSPVRIPGGHDVGTGRFPIGALRSPPEQNNQKKVRGGLREVAEEMEGE